MQIHISAGSIRQGDVLDVCELQYVVQRTIENDETGEILVIAVPIFYVEGHPEWSPRPLELRIQEEYPVIVHRATVPKTVG